MGLIQSQSIALYELSPPKLAPGGIEPETLRGAHFKVPNQHH